MILNNDNLSINENSDSEVNEDLKYENTVYLNKVINELSPTLIKRFKRCIFSKDWFKAYIIYVIYALSLNIVLGILFNNSFSSSELGWYFYLCLGIISIFSFSLVFVVDNFLNDLMINNFLKKLETLDSTEKEKFRQSLNMNVFAEMDFSEEKFLNLFKVNGEDSAAARNALGVLLKQFVENHEHYEMNRLKTALN